MRAIAFACFLASTGFASADEKDELAKYAKNLKSKDVKVRLTAAQKLADLGEPASVPLCEAMLDKDLKVATAAVKSLEKANPALFEPLNRMAFYDDDVNQFRALKSLSELGEKAHPALPLLIARFKTKLPNGTSERFRPLIDQYHATILKIADEEEKAGFHKYVAGESSYLMSDAFVWLLKWAGDKDDRRKELLPLIKKELKNEQPSFVYIRAAGELGPLAKETLSDLKRLDFAKSEDLRSEANKAIKKIEMR